MREDVDLPEPKEAITTSIPAAPDSVVEARRAIRFQEFETVCVWDKEGVYLFGSNGGVNSATIPVDPSETSGGLILHNHPSGGVFSPKDILTIRDYQPRIFEVVTPTHLYRLTAPDDGWPVNMVQEYGNWFITYRDRLKKTFERGKMNREEYEATVLVKSLERFVSSLTLKYEAIEL